MLAVKLCLAVRNLWMFGFLNVLYVDVVYSHLPVVLANLLSMHKHAILAWARGLEAVYLCFGMYWTPSMYAHPFLYYVSSYAWASLIGHSIFAGIVSNLNVLLPRFVKGVSSFTFLANLLTWVQTWLLTPAITGVVQPLADLVVKSITLLTMLTIPLSQSVYTLILPLINSAVMITHLLKDVVQPLADLVVKLIVPVQMQVLPLSQSLTTWAGELMKLVRMGGLLLDKLMEYPGIIAQVLKSMERRARRRMRRARRRVMSNYRFPELAYPFGPTGGTIIGEDRPFNRSMDYNMAFFLKKRRRAQPKSIRLGELSSSSSSSSLLPPRGICF